MAKRYDVILFDADQTLLDFDRSEREAVVATLASFDIVADEAVVESYHRINQSLWKALERGEIDKETLKLRRFALLLEEFGWTVEVQKVAATYLQELSQRGYPLDGAEALCRRLFGRVRMYIVTNGIGFIQRERQKRSGLSHYFKAFFVSEDLGYEKPDVRFFEAAAAAIDGFSKERALIVGDSLSSDMQGGIQFGIDTCWYNPKHLSLPEAMAGKITYIASSFEEIEALILEGEKE